MTFLPGTRDKAEFWTTTRPQSPAVGSGTLVVSHQPKTEPFHEPPRSVRRRRAVAVCTVNLSPYGHVQPCNSLPIAIGNVKADPFGIILERMSVHGMFRGYFLNGSCPMQRLDFVGEVSSCL